MKKLLFVLALLIPVLANAQQGVLTNKYYISGTLAVGKTDRSFTDTAVWLQIGKDTTDKALGLPRVDLNTFVNPNLRKSLYVVNIHDNKVYRIDGNIKTRMLDGSDSAHIDTLLSQKFNNADLTQSPSDNSASHAWSAAASYGSAATKFNIADTPALANGLRSYTDAKFITANRYTDSISAIVASPVTSFITVRTTADRKFTVGYQYDSARYVVWDMRKDDNDDYIKSYEMYIANRSRYAINNYSNFDSSSIAFIGAGNTVYTTTVNAYCKYTFTGTGLDFRATGDANGGLWRLMIDNDTSTYVVVSVWASVSTFMTFPIYRDLVPGTHLVTATFIGADPAHAPTTPPARGWISRNVNSTCAARCTYAIYDNIDSYTKLYPIKSPSSNQEFAFSMKAADNTGAYATVPEHNNTGTFFKITQTVTVDGNPITDWTPRTYFGKNVLVTQYGYGINPNKSLLPTVYVTSMHNISAEGMYQSAQLQFTRPDSIEYGYGIMIPLDRQFSDSIILNTGKKYETLTETPITNVNIQDSTNVKWIDAINSTNSSKSDIKLRVNIYDISNMLRLGLPRNHASNETPLILQHRSNVLQKVYSNSYWNALVGTGVIYNCSSFWQVIPRNTP